MRRRLALTGVGVALIAVLEIVVLVLVAQHIGVPATLLLVVLTSLLGAWLLRREGVRAWRALREAAAAGRPAGREVGTGLVGLLGAVLLVLPGFLTDLVGLVLLAPPVRRLTRAGVQRVAESRLSSSAAGSLFGPRRVRVRRGTPAPAPAAGMPRAGDVVPGEVVEGEIVEPR